MGKLIEFKPRKIQPAIDKETFLAMLLSEEKREEVCREFDQIEYVAEEFHVVVAHSNWRRRSYRHWR